MSLRSYSWHIDHISAQKKRYQLLRTCVTKVFNTPVITITDLASRLGKSYNGTASLVKQLVELGVLVPKKDSGKRNVLYVFQDYLNLLMQDLYDC